MLDKKRWKFSNILKVIYNCQTNIFFFVTEWNLINVKIWVRKNRKSLKRLFYCFYFYIYIYIYIYIYLLLFNIYLLFSFVLNFFIFFFLFYFIIYIFVFILLFFFILIKELTLIFFIIYFLKHLKYYFS